MIKNETRRESLGKINKTKRYAEIREILKKNKNGLTAKEMATALGYPERNYTAPRLNELEHKGEIEVIGKRYDYETNRHVSVYKLKEVEL